MGAFRDVGRRLAGRIARRAGRAELFERPGERAPQAPISEAREARAATTDAGQPKQASARDSSQSVSDADHQNATCVVAGLPELKTLLEGEGAVRVVNHWATWCIPCVEEFDELKALQRRLGSVRITGVSWDLFDPRGDEDDIREHVENFAVGHHLPWSSLLIGEDVTPEAFFQAFGVSFQQVPQTWLIGRDGRVVHRVDGVVSSSDVDTLCALAKEL